MFVKGRQIVLRDEPRGGDDEDMFRWFNMEEWAYYDHPDRPFEPVTREAFEDRLKARGADKTGGLWQRFQIDTLSGKHIGWINCYEYDAAVCSVRVGICVAEPADRGKGYGTEALRLIVDHLFVDKGLHEIRMNTWTGNKRMIRCAVSAGFEEVSRSPHRASLSVRGEALERIDFAIARGRWESLDRDME
ncbi:MAG: GNAT family N-acetyltransferase [bacterium]|jgi:RimJ/RimL family protein N-acetyltransferase